MVRFKALDAPSEWRWIQSRAHPAVCEDSQGIVAYDDVTGKIGGICVLDNFTPDACNIHIALDSPMVIRHGFLSEVATHAFITCGRGRIFGYVAGDNRRALAFDKHIGFEEVAVIPDGISAGIDRHVLRMTKADCRWFHLEHEEQRVA